MCAETMDIGPGRIYLSREIGRLHYRYLTSEGLLVHTSGIPIARTRCLARDENVIMFDPVDADSIRFF